MKTVMRIILLLSLPTLLLADDLNAIQKLQNQWAEIKYQLDEDDRPAAFEQLISQAEQLTQSQPQDPKALIWEGIIRSTYAGAKGGFGALGQVKKAKLCFEKAIELDPSAMDGSAYTSLGSLYYQVPGWPIGFGSDEKAEKFLKKGLEYNPAGIDSNFFYADFLYEQSDYKSALSVLNKALNAENRPGRELADQGRRQEIGQAIEKVKKKMGRSLPH